MECSGPYERNQGGSTIHYMECGSLPKAAQLRCPAAVERLKPCIDRREGEMVAAMKRKGIHVSPASIVHPD